MSLNSTCRIISVSKTKWKDLIPFRFCNASNTTPCNRCSHLKALNQDRLYENAFCDFTVATETRRFPVHKCVIGVASEFFKKTITTEMKEKYENFVTVHNVSAETMEMVLNYIYGEYVSITNQNIDDLFAASDYLQIFTLNSACVEYISDTKIDKENYLAFWIFAKENYIQDMLQRCYSFVKKECFTIFRQELFLSIPIEHLENILELRNVSFPEHILFEVIIRWVEYDKEQRKDYFPKLFELVNFDHLNLNDVATTVSENELVFNNLECLQKIMTKVGKTSKAASPFTNEIVFVKNHRSKLKIRTCQHNGDEFFQKEEFFVESNSIQDQRFIFAKGELYDIGGHEPSSMNSFTSLVSLNFSTKCRKKKASMLQKRSMFGCVMMRNLIYVAGGLAHKTKFLDSVECYSISNNFWRSESSMHYRRAGCCLVEGKNCLYALGGDTRVRYGSSCSSAEKFDGNEWSMIEPMSEPRSNFAAVALNDEIYAIAGYSHKAISDISETVEVYNINEETWAFVASLNHPRKGHSACVAGGKIYVAGGTDRSGDVAPVEVYNPIAADDGWKVLGNVSDSQQVDAVFNFNSV